MRRGDGMSGGSLSHNRGLLFGGGKRKTDAPSNADVYNEQTGDYFMQQNDADIDKLAEKVSIIKEVSVAIGDEAREHNRIIDNLDNQFDQTQGLLGGTMKRLDRMVKSGGGGSVTCYLALFILFIFCLLYYVLKTGK